MREKTDDILLEKENHCIVRFGGTCYTDSFGSCTKLLADLNNRGGVIVSCLEFFFQKGLGVVAVPLFFIISGATFFRNYEKKDYFRKVGARMRSLAVPYLVWNTVISVLYIVVYVTPIKTIIGAKNEFLLTWQYLFQAIFLHKRISAFWFIYNLIIFVLLTPIIDMTLWRKWTAAVFAMFLLVLPLFATDVMIKAGLWATAPIFYYVGCIIGKYYFNTFSKQSNAGIAASIVTAACIAVLLINAADVISLPIVIEQIVIILFALAFWKMMDLVCGIIRVREYMNYNFLIYVLHPFVQAVMIKAFRLLLPVSGVTALIVYTIVAVFTVTGIVVFAQFVKKYFPHVYCLISGGR